jgi:hypothetical protein
LAEEARKEREERAEGAREWDAAEAGRAVGGWRGMAVVDIVVVLVVGLFGGVCFWEELLEKFTLEEKEKEDIGFLCGVYGLEKLLVG